MGDLISRQAVEEWLEKWEGYIDQDTIARMQYRVIDIPSAQPERWIPCSERLPEDIEDTYPVVIICGDFGVSVGFYGEYVDGDRYWYDIRNDIERSTVKAWMPLPEPWKGEQP